MSAASDPMVEVDQVPEPASRRGQRALGYLVALLGLHWIASRVAILAGWAPVLAGFALLAAWIALRMARTRREARRFFQVLRAEVLAHQAREEQAPAPELYPQPHTDG